MYTYFALDIFGGGGTLPHAPPTRATYAVVSCKLLIAFEVILFTTIYSDIHVDVANINR